MDTLDAAGDSMIDLLMRHRSIRAFTSERLEPGVLERLVAAGARASTSSNMQAYTVISISDPPLKDRVAKLCADQKQIHQSAAFLVFCADLHKLSLACRMHDVEPTETGLPEALMLAVVDTALFMQNVAVAAESLGLGICMIGAIRNQPREVAEALRLPAQVAAISGLCLGKPAESPGRKPRLPLDAVLHHDGYRRDEELSRLIVEYDEQMSRWYAEQGLQPRDPRWSAIIARRLPGVAKRAALGGFLCEQGFNSR